MDRAEFIKALDFLAQGELDTVKDYEEFISKLDKDDPIVAQIHIIIEEEMGHHKFLEEAKNNPNAKYNDPSDNKEEGDEELAEASKLFKMNLGGN